MENKNSIPTTIRIFKNIKTGEWNLPPDHIMYGVQPDRHIRTPDGYVYLEVTELGKVTYAVFLLQGKKDIIYAKGYDPFKNAATGEDGLRVAKEQTERINKEWAVETSKAEKEYSIDSQIQFIRNKREKLSQEGHFTYGMYRAIEYSLRAMQQMSNVDVVKVITDLVKELRQVYTITQGPDIVDELPTIQNAEAALGMLDALNPKRGHIGTPLIKKGDSVITVEPYFPLIIITGKPFSTRYRQIYASDLLTNINDMTEVSCVMDKINQMLCREGLVVVFNNADGFLWKELENKADVSIKEWTGEEVRKALNKQPIEWKKAEMTQKRRDEIVKETARLLLRVDKKPSFLKANAIMFAIESVLNAKGL